MLLPYQTGSTIYAMIYVAPTNTSYTEGYAWNNNTGAIQAWGSGADESDWSIALTDMENGIHKLVIPPSLPAGEYLVNFYRQYSSSPDFVNDTYIQSKQLMWNGTVEKTEYNLISNLNDISAADLLAATGITEGGSWSVAKALKVMTAWAAGKWQDKSGSTTIKELLDPDDGTTVIAEITLSSSTPYKITSIQI